MFSAKENKHLTFEPYVRPPALYGGPIHKPAYLRAFLELAQIIHKDTTRTMQSIGSMGYVQASKFYHRLTALCPNTAEKAHMRQDLINCLDLVKVTASNGKIFYVSGPSYRFADTLYVARESLCYPVRDADNMCLIMLGQCGMLTDAKNKAARRDMISLNNNYTNYIEDHPHPELERFELSLDRQNMKDLFNWVKLNNALMQELEAMIEAKTERKMSLSDLREANRLIAEERAKHSEA